MDAIKSLNSNKEIWPGNIVGDCLMLLYKLYSIPRRLNNIYHANTFLQSCIVLLMDTE